VLAYILVDGDPPGPSGADGARLDPPRKIGARPRRDRRAGTEAEVWMRKDRLAYFRKRLVDKQRQLVEEVGRSALYGKDQENYSLKDLGDQANTAFNR
jgi:hypothetical protein